MIKLLSVAILAGFCFASSWAIPPPWKFCWTDWYDIDDPQSRPGDSELLADLRAKYPRKICWRPRRIEARTIDTHIPALETGDDIDIFSPSQGLVCLNHDQTSGMCHDYEVRFWCPCRKHS